MMDGIVYLISLVIMVACSIRLGYILGKANRNIKLEGLGAQEAFAYFATKEMHRHREDIAQIKRDLKFLDSKGIKAPDIPLTLWFEVAKKGGK